jgi:hypothetical protein
MLWGVVQLLYEAITLVIWKGYNYWSIIIFRSNINCEESGEVWKYGKKQMALTKQSRNIWRRITQQ